MGIPSLGGGLRLPGGNLGLNRPGGLGGNKPISSISQNRAVNNIAAHPKIAHVYQSGDKTSLYGAGQAAGHGSAVSITQMGKKPGISATMRAGSGSKPIIPIIK